MTDLENYMFWSEMYWAAKTHGTALDVNLAWIEIRNNMEAYARAYRKVGAADDAVALLAKAGYQVTKPTIPR